MNLLKALLSVSTLVLVGLGITLLVWGQEMPPSAGQPAPPALIDPSLLEFVKVFGFGAMIFMIWWGDYRKIGKLQRMVEQYESLTKNYESITKECRDTMLLTMDVNAKLTGKLEMILEKRA